MRRQHLTSLVLVAALGVPIAAAEDTAPVTSPRVGQAIVAAWVASKDAAPSAPAAVPPTLARAVGQRAGQAARAPAGPNIGTVGLGFIGGLSDLELGPSLRYWATDRFGFQAHLGFSGDDIGPNHVDFIRFEPTFIVAIGDFGDGAINIRPYAGGGLRIARTDIGRLSDSDVKPVGVGGVEFGFSGAPRLKLSTEVSLAPNIDTDDFDPPRRGPRFTGARVALLGHYFF